VFSSHSIPDAKENEYMIRAVIDAMLRDCESRDLSPNTIEYYEFQCRFFAEFCESQGVTDIEKVTADLLRQYLICLKEAGHNEGGVHAKYRAMKTLMLWYEREFEPDHWKNPIHKIRPPKVPEVPPKPVNLQQVEALLRSCDQSLSGRRDYAIILFWLDTGVRVSEGWAIRIHEVDVYAGTAYIREGKGGRPRTVQFGRKTAKALRKYLRMRRDQNPSLWVTEWGDTYAVKSMQTMLARRCELAGIEHQSPHQFRKSFITIMSRRVDIFRLMALSGNKNVEVLKKHYVAIDPESAREAHRMGSPVDRLLE
jgi:site-specific recombinase XerD